MKLSKLSFGALLLSALTLSGCSDDSFTSSHDDFATLRLSLAADDTVETGEFTRAGEPQSIATALNDNSFALPAAENFTIEIKNKSTSEQIHKGLLSAYDTATELKFGTYTVTATYDNETVGFYSSTSNPAVFEGETEFTVSEKKTYEVAIPVTLQNCILKVAYTDLFKAYYKDYSVTIDGTTDIVFSSTETRGAFVTPGNSVRISYTCTPTQAQGTNNKAITKEATLNLEGGKSYVLTFDVKDVGGVAGFTVTINDTVVDALTGDSDNDGKADGDVDINQDEYIDDDESDDDQSNA